MSEFLFYWQEYKILFLFKKTFVYIIILASSIILYDFKPMNVAIYNSIFFIS